MTPAAQAPRAVVLVRPHAFAPNPATAADNAFQRVDPHRSPAAVAAAAFAETTALAAALREHGVTVHLFEDEDTTRPDSVFPNNWFSTHHDGRIAVHPMWSPSRRTERRADVLATLDAVYRVRGVVDHSALEDDGIFLEGTGAMVLDHVGRVAYTARSNRADPRALQRFCAEFDYAPHVFDTRDRHGVPVYHTNVLLGLATEFALVGLDLVAPEERTALADRLAASGRTVVPLTHEQIGEFAANAIEVQGAHGRVLVMSARARASLTPAQRAVIERSCPIVAVAVPTIELAGGSVRCMVAGVHLAPREGAATVDSGAVSSSSPQPQPPRPRPR